MKLYQREQVYRLDQLAIKQDGQAGLQLMQKAALAVWRAVQKNWSDKASMVVLAGPGNNGGDAYAVAILARNDGYTVNVISVGDISHQSVESATFRQQWLDSGGAINAWTGQCPECDIIIDGLLGIGLNKSLSSEWQSMIRTINQHPAKRVCIDIPSGLNANTGNAMPCAVQADLTVTFIARKAGCFVADGPDYSGELVFDDLGLSSDSSQRQEAILQVLDETGIQLPALRKNNSYKNQFGHVLVIGGNRGMSGATRLAGMAALRSGTGLVTLCVHPDNESIVAATEPELMVTSWDDLPAILTRASVIVVGPGLGQCERSAQILQQLSGIDTPLIIDADAIEAGFVSSLTTLTAVLSPHPGEAARLLGTTSAEIQQDRVAALQQILEKWPYACVLKGAGSLIGQRDKPLSLCSRGHAGMATAGMGDVLSGIIAAYLAQGLDALQATQSAVFVHALAAEEYARDHDQNSLIASDIIDMISRVTFSLTQHDSRA